jgi:hypothetical protein
VPKFFSSFVSGFFLCGLVGDLVVRVWKRGDRICLLGL